MTIIRVNPESIRTYGAGAQSSFNAITTSLKQLANDVVGVHYFGPNAVAFKTECGTMAESFATQLHAAMAAMADAVRVSTSNIAASLGGQPISIQIAQDAVTAPQPVVVDYVDVDTSALEAVLPVVRGHFGAIEHQLTSHLTHLSQTDWQGNAKVNAVGKVAEFTGRATTACGESLEQLVARITVQLDAAVLADR